MNCPTLRRLVLLFPEVPSRFPFLFERLQISNELVHFLISHLHVWHQTTQLDPLRIAHPEVQVILRVWCCTCSQRFATHQVSQVRTEFPLRRRAANRVTIDAGVRKECLATFS